MDPLPPIARLADEVRAAVVDLPYAVVDETPAGFALQLDVVDARWWETFRRAGLEKTWRWEVTVTGPDTYRVGDWEVTLDWHAGVDPTTGGPAPGLRFEASRFSGQAVHVERRTVLGVGDDGREGRVVDYSFDSREGREVIDTAAQRLGVRPAGPGAGGGLLDGLTGPAKVGLLVAAVTLVGLLVGGVVLAVLLVLVL